MEWETSVFVHGDVINLLLESINTIKKYAQALDAGKEACQRN
jgi:hypothetical protein